MSAPTLDEVECLEAPEQAVDRRAGLVEQLRQATRRRLALLRQLFEEVYSLCQRADRVLANLCLADVCRLRCQLPTSLFRILDRVSA